jgi:hypothetical protein
VFLAGADAGSLPDAELVDCLKQLELASASLTAARARILTAFNARGVYEDDGARSPKSWLTWQTRTTKAAAGASIAWMRRLAVHPKVADALAAAAISESWARQLCDWSDAMPPDVREDADQILLDEARAGMSLTGLSTLAEELYARTCGPDSDHDDDSFTERSLRLDLHWRGHGRLTGQLTPECAAAVSAVLDSLAKRAGPEDTRTQPQRNHDAVEEACRRLVADGLPDAAGQPAQIQLHITLSQLQDLARTSFAPQSPGARRPGGRDSRGGPGDAPSASYDPNGGPPAGGGGPASTAASSAGSGASGPWAEDAWLAARGTAYGVPGWLSGPAAAAYACDAAIAPVITGTIDPGLLDQLITQLTATAAGCSCGGPAPRGTSPPGGSGPPGSGPDPPASTAESRQQIEELILRAAADLLSGPGGLTAHLRTSLADPRLSKPSLPLDIGQTDKIPAHLRRLVAVRHPHCAFPGCTQPARRSQVHHLIPRAQGGATALNNLVPLCAFHHLIAIHRWGWALKLNGDGTTTATSPDGSKSLCSHGPPGTLAA